MLKHLRNAINLLEDIHVDIFYIITVDDLIEIAGHDLSSAEIDFLKQEAEVSEEFREAIAKAIKPMIPS